MARAFALERFQQPQFDVAGVARMLLEDLSAPAPAQIANAEETPPPEPEIDRDSFDFAAGVSEGREAAMEEAAAEVAAAIARAEAAEARVAALEPQLTGALEAIEQARRGAERRMAADAAAILGAALEALLPEFARKGFAAEAGASVREWLSRAASAEGVLYVPPGFEAELSAAVAASAGPESNVRVSADAELAAGAARFEWRDGIGELDLNESAGRIRAAFQAHVDRLGLAEAVAAKALTPPTEVTPTEVTPAEKDADVEPQLAAEAEAGTEAEAEVAAPARKPAAKTTARKTSAAKQKAADAAEPAADNGSAEAAPAKKAPARRRKTKAAEASADAASEETVKKAPSRRRASGAAKSAKTTSGDKNE